MLSVLDRTTMATGISWCTRHTFRSRTQANSYSRQVVPKTIRTSDNSYPNNSYPRQLVANAFRTQDNSYPRQLVVFRLAKSKQWKWFPCGFDNHVFHKMHVFCLDRPPRNPFNLQKILKYNRPADNGSWMSWTPPANNTLYSQWEFMLIYVW